MDTLLNEVIILSNENGCSFTFITLYESINTNNEELVTSRVIY